MDKETIKTEFLNMIEAVPFESISPFFQMTQFFVTKEWSKIRQSKTYHGPKQESETAPKRHQNSTFLVPILVSYTDESMRNKHQ